MNTLAMSQQNAAWNNAPWGMAAIDVNGMVTAVNPSFEQCTKIAASQSVGMSEADFVHLMLDIPLIERSRIEVTDGNLRAIHYLYCSDGIDRDNKVTQLAEVLREPLASIYGFAELLLTQYYDEQTRQDLTAMLLGQVEEMNNLLNKVTEKRKRWSRATDKLL